MKRWAKVLAGLCVTVVDQDSAPSLDGFWLDVTSQAVGPGNIWDGSTWSAPVAGDRVVSMRQARLALLAAGKLASVQTAINSLSEPQKTQAQISWDYASEVRRHGPMLPLIATAAGLNDAQIDALFDAAEVIP